MMKRNQRRQWLGVIGGAGLTLLLYINLLNVLVHVASGHGSFALGVMGAVVFAAATGFFGYLTAQKAGLVS